MSRQNYYKHRRQRQRHEVDEALVVALVHRERALQPRLGGRKLRHMLQADLAEAAVSIGRDRFFAVLRAHGLLVGRRPRSARTTDSRHSFRVYENLLAEAALTGPHQAWVSDITYLRTAEGFVYVSLVMDAYSRMIVGFDCSDTLEREGALRAARQAIRQLPAGAAPIHHSDRGSQYCCGDYVRCLEAAGIQVSMTQANHCYENARAERLNGILKQEYGLGGCLRDTASAQQAVSEAVALYNGRRPHTALGYSTPMRVHRAA